MQSNKPYSLIVLDDDSLVVERGNLEGIRETMDFRCRLRRCSFISVHESFEAAQEARRRALRWREARDAEDIDFD